jgi:hypothetical protein
VKSAIEIPPRRAQSPPKPRAKERIHIPIQKEAPDPERAPKEDIRELSGRKWSLIQKLRTKKAQ